MNSFNQLEEINESEEFPKSAPKSRKRNDSEKYSYRIINRPKKTKVVLKSTATRTTKQPHQI